MHCFSIWKKIAAGSILLFFAPHAIHALEPESLFALSLEELLAVKTTTGKLIDSNKHESPSAITVIQREHIEHAPVKNLAELLEIYVPGLMLMAHSEGDKIGLRGNIAAENYKLLLLVNGKNITNMVYEGLILEIDQWDLSDVEKVEIVRGPGSVVYGTGAIAGVVNIITKDASSSADILNLAYNSTYNSKGFSYQTSHTIADLKPYFFASYRKTEGLQDPDYYIPTGSQETDNRYIGKNPNDSFGPQPYLGDAFDRPQIKLHASLNYQDSFQLFTRYTQSGQTHHFRAKSPKFDHNDNLIDIVDNRQVSLRSFVFAPEYTLNISEIAGLKTAFTYDSQEYIRYDQANPNSPDEHPDNVKDYAFSQNRSIFSTLYTFEKPQWNLTTGYEYSHINIAAPWGKNKDHIMIREGIYMISDRDSSVYTQNPDLKNRPGENAIEEIGSGLDFYTHSHLLEGNYSFTNNFSAHYGHRFDFADVSNSMYAPRFALIGSPANGHKVTASAQRALRKIPLRAQYLFDKHGNGDDKHEKLDSIELAYTNQISKAAYLTARSFYDKIDAIGFTGFNLQFLADIELAGLEIESVFQGRTLEVLFNHSYLELLDFKMNENLKTGANRNNISFSDYYHVTRTDIPLELESTGSALNNWSTNTSKLVLTKKLFEDSLSLHLNTQIYWDYEGSWDEMTMYQKAYDNFDTSTLSREELAIFETQKSQFENEKQLLDSKNAFDPQYNIGASISYKKKLKNKRKLKSVFYIQNLLGSRKRYYVSTGSSKHYPNRLSFMEEPATFGVRFELSH